MQKIALLALLLAAPVHAATYYFSNSGNDSGACSLTSPCKTVARANQIIQAAGPGDALLFNGGDRFTDTYLLVGSLHEDAVGAPHTAIVAQGVRLGSYGTGQAVIDSADALTCSGGWTLVQGTTWSCALASGSSLPTKLYVDPTFANFTLSAQGNAAPGSSMLQQQLLPVPNLIGPAGSCSGTVGFLDAFGPFYDENGDSYLRINPSGTPVTCDNLTNTYPVSTHDAMQGFNSTSSGIANVEAGVDAFAPAILGFGYPAYPGAWWGTSGGKVDGNDAFAYSGSPQSPWTGQGFVANGGNLTTNGGGQDDIYYTGSYDTAQHSNVVQGTITGSGDRTMPSVRVTSSGGYFTFASPGKIQLYSGYLNGSQTLLSQIGTDVVAGHEYSLSIDSAYDLTLTDVTAGTTLITVTDKNSLYPSGAPGLNSYGTASNPVTSWHGGNNADGSGVPTVYVNLRDGTNPNTHTFSGTQRPYGVLIEATNGVTVDGLIVAHSEQSCILVRPYSRYEQLASDVTVENSTVFNCANPVRDTLPQASGGTISSEFNGGIVFEPTDSPTPLLMKSPHVINNHVGTIDTWFGSNETAYSGGIVEYAIDGAGVGNTCVICANIVAASNTAAILYTGGPVPIKVADPVQNLGGRVSGNNVTASQTGINFAGVIGGLLDHNKIFESYGQGLQIGGPSLSVDGGPTGPVAGSQVIAYNTIANIGLDSIQGDYNGIDCNSSATAFAHFYEIGNTIYNTWGASATYEQAVDASTLIQAPNAGCTAPYTWGNVLDQNAVMFGNGNSTDPSETRGYLLSRSPKWRSQADSLPNTSHTYYINNNTAFQANFTPSFRKNWYREYPGVTDVGSYGRTCAMMAQQYGDTSTCAGGDPLYVAPLPGSSDVRLQSTSPLLGAGVPGVNNGNVGVYVTGSVLGFTNSVRSGGNGYTAH